MNGQREDAILALRGFVQWVETGKAIPGSYEAARRELPKQEKAEERSTMLIRGCVAYANEGVER